LNLPRYIDSTEPEELQDIDAYLRGGIIERDIDICVSDNVNLLVKNAVGVKLSVALL
jgi:hypothetical protein